MREPVIIRNLEILEPGNLGFEETEENKAIANENACRQKKARAGLEILKELQRCRAIELVWDFCCYSLRVHGNVFKCVCTRVSFHSCRPLRSFLKFVCMHICVVQIQIMHMRLLPCDALAPFSFSLLPWGDAAKAQRVERVKGQTNTTRLSKSFRFPMAER